MDLKFQNSKLDAFYTAWYYFLWNVNILELRGPWSQSGTGKSGWIILYASFSKETKAKQRIISRNSSLSIHIKIYLQSFVYHHHPHEYFYYWNVKLNYFFICKINIRGNFIKTWLWYIWFIFLFFEVNGTFDTNFCIFRWIY